MIKHYLLITLRHLLRDRMMSFINISGLVIGFSIGILIFQYVNYELSFDEFHANGNETFRLTRSELRNDEILSSGPFTPFSLGVSSLETIPEVVGYSRIHPEESGIVSIKEESRSFEESDILFVDKNFLQLFSYQLLKGDAESCLQGQSDIVISQEAAKKYFGNEDPMGKRLTVSGNWVRSDFIITGVLGNLPSNTHLKFDFLIPMDMLLAHDQYKNSDGWGWTNFVTYLKVDDASSASVVTQKLNRLVNDQIGDELAKANVSWEMTLQSLSDIHLKSDFPEDLAANNGDILNVRILTIIGVFILVIAWANYINLSIGRAIRRAREVGVRKSFGAYKEQIVVQFMAESILLNVLSAMLAIGVSYLLLPALNTIVGVELNLTLFSQTAFWVYAIIILLLGSFLSGFYPAFVIASFHVINALKSEKLQRMGGFALRKGLIIFQFCISLLLISGTYFVYQQIRYMKNKDLGIEMEKILVAKGPRNSDFSASKLRVLKDELKEHNTFESVTCSGHVPSTGFNWRGGVRKLGKAQDQQSDVTVIFVDNEFNSTYDFDFMSGSPFAATMSSHKDGVIINEEAVNMLELGSPEKALEEKLIISAINDTVKIIGVIENFHWSSLKQPNSPYLFAINPYICSYVSSRVTKGGIQESVDHLEETYLSLFPGEPFDYFFLNKEFEKQYKSEVQFGDLLTSFSLLSVIITCLGLFALVTFSTAQRRKEISVRKVHGASLSGLMFLLVREYVILLIIASAISLPVVFYFGQSWMENFAFRKGFDLGVFVFPVLTLAAISFVTILRQILSLARINPTEALRND